MNVVLYTRDMEPITVIDLPMWALEAGDRRGIVALPVMPPVPLKFLDQGEPIPTLKARAVWLEFHRIRLRDSQSWIVTVNDDELALTLKPAWLPGQRAKINQYEDNTRRLSAMLLDVLAKGLGGH